MFVAEPLFDQVQDQSGDDFRFLETSLCAALVLNGAEADAGGLQRGMRFTIEDEQSR